MTTFSFIAAHLSLALLGLPAAFHRSTRDASPMARGAAAFAAGAVALTLVATLYSILGVRWSAASLSLPLFAVSLALAIRWRRQPFRRAPHGSRSRAIATAAAAIAGLALVHLAFWLASAHATSPDFLFFWGVKGARFAAAGGIDPALLSFPFSHHMVPDYPPLLPIVFSWSTLVAGELPWTSAPVVTALWVAAAIPLVVWFLRRRLTFEATAAIAAFWTVALAISMAHSSSGGNAEAPLLFFETVALAALLAERPEEPDRSRFLPALALSGAALTKVEGSVAVLLVVAGVALRDFLERRPRAFRRVLPLLAAPLACVTVWFAFQATHGLPVGYRPHGELLGIHFRFFRSTLLEMAQNLDAGTAWLSWIVPLAFIAASARRLRAESLPALALALGLLVFFLFDYLHDPTDPSIRIGWTLRRISQPALSAVILAAGLASASRARAAVRAFEE